MSGARGIPPGPVKTEYGGVVGPRTVFPGLRDPSGRLIPPTTADRDGVWACLGLVLVWPGLVWPGPVWVSLAWPGPVWVSLGWVWSGSGLGSVLAWSGLAWSGLLLVWSGPVWSGLLLVWSGLVWFWVRVWSDPCHGPVIGEDSPNPSTPREI